MAIIDSVATAVSRRSFLARGALRLADNAIVRCMEQSGRDPRDLDLLVNAGIYREKNLAEPALAAMIQEDIGANPGHPRREHDHGTFSFDVANGACGVLTAIELVDGLIASRTVRLGAVVASDSNPGNAASFPFPAAGGAVLLRPGESEAEAGTGFLDFDSATFPEFADSFESSLVWRPSHRSFPFSPSGRNLLEIERREGYEAQMMDCAEGAVRRFLRERDTASADVDLLVASAFPATFAFELSRRLGIAPGAIAMPEAPFEGAHTAGILASLEPAFRSGRLSRARHALFVSAGAGIVIATALYRHPGAG